MKKNVIVKMSFFSIISVAFIAYLFYCSDALAKGKVGDNINYGTDFFLNKIPFFENINFSTEYKSAERDSIIKTFSVDQKGTLYIDVSHGDIEINTWDKNEVRVIVQRKGSEDVLENYKISFESTKDKVSITSETKKKFWNFGKNMSIVFNILIPKQFYPDIKTSGGDILIRDLFSNSKLRTSGGDVSLFNSTGNVDIKTSGGDIKIYSNNGNINAATSGGDIVFKQINGNVDASTTGGDIVLKEIKGSINTSTSGGDIEAEILGENKGVSLSTSGGDIEIKIAGSAKADLDCKTSGGDVSLSSSSNFEGTIKSTSVVGKLNGGGPQIKAKTSGGDIDISFRK